MQFGWFRNVFAAAAERSDPEYLLFELLNHRTEAQGIAGIGQLRGCAACALL